MTAKEKAYALLEKAGIKHERFVHLPLFTCEDASKVDYGNTKFLEMKNLFLRNKDKSMYYLVCMPAAKRANLKALEKVLEETRFSFGTPEDMMEKLGVTPGSVSLLNSACITSSNICVAIDSEVLKSEYIGFHPNDNTETVVFKSEAVHTILGQIAAPSKIVTLEAE